MGFKRKQISEEEQKAIDEATEKRRVENYNNLDEEDKYDSNGNEIILEDYDEIEDDPMKDKIFGNAYNSGETGYHDLPDIKAEGDYAGRHLGHVYDSEEYNIQMKLSDMCSSAFDESQWAGLPLSKKFSKELMPYIFQDLFKVLDVDGHSVVDCFIAIAEFMDVSYEKVYWSAGNEVQKRLIAECNAKHGSLDKKNINRLF